MTCMRSLHWNAWLGMCWLVAKIIFVVLGGTALIWAASSDFSERREAQRLAATATAPAPETRPAEPVDLGPIVTPFDRAALRLWSLESSCGKDPDWRIVGEAGERGQLRATPIWLDDYERIFGVRPDPMNTQAMLTEYVPNYLWWWSAERGYRADRVSIETLVQMYQEGP